MDLLKYKRNFYRLSITILPLFIFWGLNSLPAQEAVPGVCYGSTGNQDGGRLISIDLSTGTGTLIGDTGEEAVPSIAINSLGEIYGLNERTGEIYLIDATTGTSELVTVTGLDQFFAMAFDTNDVLYGHSSNSLYTIDLSTGASTLIGYTGAYLRGLAFNPITNALWGSSWWEIYTINTTTGAGTLVGNTELETPLTDISFDIAGNLYASSAGGFFEESYLVTIDKSSGSASVIGEIGFQSVSGLSIYNVILEGIHIGIVPERVDYGLYELGTTPSPRTISISNIGSELLTVTDISTDDPEVLLSNLPALPIVLPSKSSQSFEVTISVTDTGVFNKTISISSNDQDRPEIDIQLTGRAITIQPAQNGLCYASTGRIDGGRLLQIDPSNGTGTLIGDTDLNAIPGIAINSEGFIYGLNENSGDIYKIDAITGYTTNPVQTGINGLVAIAFDTSDVLYGFSSWETNLYILDLQTGSSSLIGYVGYSLRGLAFHPLNNTLWANSPYEIFQINPSNATVTWTGYPDLDYSVTDLDFNLSGSLYATVGGGQNEDNYLASINQSTGQGELIGEIGFQSVSGLNFFNKPLEGRFLSVIPSGINFEVFEAGDTSAVKMVSLQNIGTEILTVTEISASDLDIILTDMPALPITLPSRSSYTFEVSVTVDDPGQFNKSLSITSNDQDNPVQEVPVYGQSIVLTPAENGYCYASTGHEDGANFLRIAPGTGRGDLIGNTGLDAVPAITIDSEGWVYGLEARSNDIYKIDAETGYAVAVTHTDIEGLIAIEFDTSDVLYGYSSDNSGLYTIDLNTGHSTLIGNSMYGLRGLSFNPIDNSLWGSYFNELYSIDANDGSYTYVGPANLNYPLTDIAFDIAGNLFGTSGGNMEEDNQFVSLNTETGQGTIIGEIGYRSVSGLDFYTAPLEGRYVYVSPDTLNFDFIEVRDSSYVHEIQITNIGTEILTISDIVASDTTVILVNLPDFPLVLPSRLSQIIETQMFVPDTGIFQETLTITSDSQDGAEHTVVVTGRGVIIAPADSGMWYASTGHDDGGRFLSINPTTGEGTLIGETGLDAVPAIAINSKGKIYGISASSGWLCRIDGQSGNAFNLINTNLSRITSLAFDNNDQLYAYSDGTSSLYLINLDNNEVELIGYADYGLRGLSFNPLNNSLWGARWWEIMKINSSDGSTELIGNTFLDGPVTDINFDIFGNLYATTGGNYSTNTLAYIDKSSGTGTEIGEIGFDAVSGFACYNTPISGRHLRVSPSELLFGDVVAGDSSATRTLTLGNIGSDDLTIENISLSDTGQVFANLPELPQIIPSLDFFTVDVRLIPENTGSINETMTILSDDPDFPSVEVPIEAEAFSVSLADSGILYASTGHRDGGRLLKIDPVTGQGTLIGETGLNAVPGIAINSKGEIYGVDPFEGNLYRIDAESGYALLIGSTGVFRMITITFDSLDNLYGYSDEMESIYEIDPQTGSSELYLEIDQYLRSIAFNPVDNTLWASTNDDRIFLINQSDGTTETIGITALPSGIPTINFDLFGNLLGTVHLGWNSSQLFRFDIKSKEVNIIGDIGFESVSSLAYYNVPKPGSHIQITPGSIDFGLTAVGDTSFSKSVTIFSIGTEPLVIDEISADNSAFILTNTSALPWTLNTGESRAFDVVFSPTDIGVINAMIEISSNDSDSPTVHVDISGEGSEFSIDGLFNEPGYKHIASKLNSNSSFGADMDVTNIYSASDDTYFILGIECRVQNTPNEYDEKSAGLGIFLNFSVETGMEAGAPLAHWEEYDHHFLNGGFELWDGGMEFAADFEVDYIFAVYSDGSPDRIMMDASTFIWDNPHLIQYIGSTDQSGTSGFGPSVDGVFDQRSIQFAFQSSPEPESKMGIEIRIPLADINADPSDEFQVFATLVSATAYFSDVSVPGNITVEYPGFNPDFLSNLVDDDCSCPSPGATLGDGPYHSDWNTIVVGINEEGNLIPTEYALSQNYPNPFNPLTTIEYQLPEAAEIEMVIYNILGQEILTLVKEKKLAGYHSMVWNAVDNFGKAVASGLYIYRLNAKGISGRKFVQVKKMVVLK
jgi:hypothetical protein